MKIIFISNCFRYEFNRPYLQHKELQTDDALAVEATSYALLTLFLVEVIQIQTIYFPYFSNNICPNSQIFLRQNTLQF